jgi:hypothetical protein
MTGRSRLHQCIRPAVSHRGSGPAGYPHASSSLVPRSPRPCPLSGSASVGPTDLPCPPTITATRGGYLLPAYARLKRRCGPLGAAPAGPGGAARAWPLTRRLRQCALAAA